MKLLFLFTGGTIGSTARGAVVSVDESKPYLLLEKYAEQYSVDFSYDTISLFSELSENFSGEHVARIAAAVCAASTGDYDGIIVTHGTDTLAYTAAALGYALGVGSLPVCLVSAGYPIEDARSNGIANLHAAVSLIRARCVRGVLVPYRNPHDTDTACHRATRLSTSLALREEVFSVSTPLGRVDADGHFAGDPAYRETSDALGAPPSLALSAQSTGILRVFPYPGMIYPAIPEGTHSILLETYHSGTIDGRSSAVHAFLTEARERGISLFVSGSAAYESARVFDAYGVTRLPIAPTAAYMKLWLYGRDTPLLASRGGDVF